MASSQRKNPFKSKVGTVLSRYLRIERWCAGVACEWNDLFRILNKRSEEDILNQIDRWSFEIHHASKRWKHRGKPKVVPLDKAKGLLQWAIQESLFVKRTNSSKL